LISRPAPVAGGRNELLGTFLPRSGGTTQDGLAGQPQTWCLSFSGPTSDIASEVSQGLLHTPARAGRPVLRLAAVLRPSGNFVCLPSRPSGRKREGRVMNPALSANP